jgi:thermitase
MAHAQPAGIKEQYYYADGVKVPLVPSSHFVAVKDTAPASAGGARLDTILGSVAGAGEIIDLPQYHLKVIRVPDARGAAAESTRADSIRSTLSAQPDTAVVPPVYELAAGPAADSQALIPVGEILVRFKAGTAAEDKRALLSELKLNVRRADYPEPGTDLVATESEQETVDIANRLHENELVDYAQPNFAVLTPRLETPTLSGGLVNTETAPLESPPLEAPDVATLLGIPAPSAEPTAPPTDPNFASQWGLVKIKAPEAFDISMGNPSISIAIIDEGNDLSHEDLVYKTPGYDAYDGDNNPSPQAADAHGTACAGIAAARANNAKGGAGVAPNCKVLPIRIARGIGGGFWDTSDAKVADGIRKAVDRGADVLSNSYGVPPSTVVTNAFNYARTNGRGGKGCPTAAATGNGDVRNVIYPARLSPTIPGFLAVGASNEWDQRKSKTSLDGENWWGSNFGPEVDVVAPGVHIFTTDITGAAGYGGGNYIPNFNGTSSATPHVAGLMALILSVDPDLRSWEVEDIIKLTAEDLGPAGRDEDFGFGRINCRRALEAASRLWYAIDIGVEFLGAGRQCFMRANVRMYNPGINTVRLDALTLTSHNPTWTTELDRFEYRPNPGGTMAPRSGQDLRINSILLKANGNLASWSYRWSLQWAYTFWRPTAAAFPMIAETPLVEADGRSVNANPVRGQKTGAQRPAQPDHNRTMALPTDLGAGALATNGGVDGDSITIDRHSKTITVVIR